MGVRPKPAPKYRLYHLNWRRGYFANSLHGDRQAHRQRKVWRDRDFHLSSDLAVMNMHGAPEKFWGPWRAESKPWPFWRAIVRRVGKQFFRIRDARTAFADAKATGGKVEFEVKDWRPLASDANLRAVFARVFRHAENTWGPSWRKHLTIKVVSTMGGGYDSYGSRVFAAARAEDPRVNTLLSVRGRDRFRTFEGHTEITWVRGSAVIR